MVSNLDKMITADFSGERFPVQPDVKRMLDSVYGKFDVHRNEENRHGIVALKQKGDIE